MSVSSPNLDASAGGSSPLRPQGLFPVGRMFVNPLFDYLLIGGVLSVILIPFLPTADGILFGSSEALYVAAVVLLVNGCHFAASTVRLYTKEGMFERRPFYTMVFPLVSLLVVGACIASDETLGKNFYRLYLTWSPYHYAAQAYGLAFMYGHRSGAKLRTGDSRLLWYTAMLPFLYAFFSSDASGLMWFVPRDWPQTYPQLGQAIGVTKNCLGVLVFALPVVLFLRTRSGGRPGLPMISFAILLSNGIWWIVFSYTNAFGWATVAHGVQYLAIILIFHVRESRPGGGSVGEIVRVVVRFYAICVALSYLLFQVLPYAYAAVGFPLASSLLVVSAAISIHHFIIDRVIWRQRKDPNMKVVVK